MRKGLLALLIPFSIILSSCKDNSYSQLRYRIKLFADETVSAYFSYDFKLDDYLTIKDNNKKQALMGMVFASSIADDLDIEFKSDKGNIDVGNDALAKHLNLDDFEFTITSPGEIDDCDINSISMCHKKYKNTEICFVSVMESEGGKTWLSNFDVGYDDASYYDKTGEHPEWTNKDNHKGFDVTANRCLKEVKKYISRYLDANCPQIYYIYGHSRGGAVANLLSSKMVDENYQVVSYSYSSPATTTSNEATSSKYKNLHTYNCKEDFIANILKEDWGFTRYGDVTTFSMKDYRDTYKKMNGTGIPAGSSSSILKMFGSLVDSREEIYHYDDKFVAASSNDLTQSEVDSFINECTSGFDGTFSSLSNFVDIQTASNVDDTYNVKILVCPGFYTQLAGLAVSAFFTGDFDTDYLSDLSPYTNLLLNISGLSITSFANININYIVESHYYYSFLSYFC